MNPAPLGALRGCGSAAGNTALSVVALVGFVLGGGLLAGTIGIWIGLVLGLVLLALVVIGSFAKAGDVKLRCHDCGLEWWRAAPPEF